MEDELIKFVWKFFKNLNSSLAIKNGIIYVSNVSENFEKFYGKKSPYKFTTDKNLVSEEIDLLENSSYILKVISNYLENSAKTTLLKINFNSNGEEEIRRRLNLLNSKIEKIKTKRKNSIFFRFTFHSSFQYLNETEKLINEIYIHDGKIINGDLNGYKLEEGKKEEIQIPDIREQYFLAKEELKKRIENKIEELSFKLSTSLEKEIKRIEDHFKIKEKEILNELKRATEKQIELKKEKEKNKLERQNNLIQNLKEKLNPEEFLNDKERSIFIEKTKHSLNVDNKLFNTTIIYHELIAADVTIKNENTKRTFEAVYNPLTKKIEKIKCSVCSKKLEEIYLCKEGHLSCKNCTIRCKSCSKEFCKNCIKFVCEICNSLICNGCKVRCFGCGKNMCKNHTIQDKITKRFYCNKCLKKCERCATLKIENNFKISKKTGVKICFDCYSNEIKNSIIKSLN